MKKTALVLVDNTASFSDMALDASETALKIAKFQGCEDVVFSWMDDRGVTRSAQEPAWLKFLKNGAGFSSYGVEMMDVAHSVFKLGKTPDSLLICSDFCEDQPAKSRWLADGEFVEWLMRCADVGVVIPSKSAASWEAEIWSRSLRESTGLAPMVWGASEILSLREVLELDSVAPKGKRALAAPRRL